MSGRDLNTIERKGAIIIPRIGYLDLAAVERFPTSPGALSDALSGVLVRSLAARAKLKSCNRHTGEYRVVIHGTLDLQATEFESR